ncbi:alpha/beta hydrolase [Phaeodactylibacter xiamenensis]|uniref:alpha/beta hydrolase n=1 Tax=Phaeodactylibacter xiamenensis TaxID=1524460 RepID=UPI003CCC1CA5
MRYQLTLLLTCLVLLVQAQQRYSTVTYFETDSFSLELDLFLPETPSPVLKPLLIYVHGGGFSGGDRAGGHKLCAYLSEKGIAAATITYTLYMKDKSFSCDGILSEKIQAIRLAANQLWQATAFFEGQAEKYGIDPSKIFIAGSSAGAETVLHAAFWDRSVMQLYGDPLPGRFQYAGLIGGAGAIMDMNGIMPKTAIPAMLFHGTVDPLVPYGTAAHHYCDTDATGWLMLFGSHSIYERYRDIGADVELHSFCGGGHGFAGAYFYKDQERVADFINRVLDGAHFQNHLIFQKGDKDAPEGQVFCHD